MRAEGKERSETDTADKARALLQQKSPGQPGDLNCTDLSLIDPVVRLIRPFARLADHLFPVLAAADQASVAHRPAAVRASAAHRPAVAVRASVDRPVVDLAFGRCFDCVEYFRSD
jgi:hypothetical protein